MNFEINSWLAMYMSAVKKEFDDRIWFAGLQGSFARGEATAESDIDVVLILDELTADDAVRYSRVLDTLPNRDLVCGFMSGREELLSWEPMELFQFYYDTIPLHGSLDELLQSINRRNIIRGIHFGGCGVYHMCVHNMVHEKDLQILKDLYKSAVFTLHGIGYLRSGKYERDRSALAECLRQREKDILKSFYELKNIKEASIEDIERYSARMLSWSSAVIREYKEV